jgi:hypothetical protein
MGPGKEDKRLEEIVISILWFTISGLLLFQNAEACA